MNFGEVITAMVTPFDQNEEIDYEATKNLVNHLINNGTDAIVVAGTTGESPTLTKEEKLELFSFVVKEANKRVAVIAGTGMNSTKESIDLTIAAEKCGVDGIMLVSPYYNRPNQKGLYEHFKVVAAATSLPVMLYNIPGRTACNIDVETTVALSKIENIVCVKEASGDLDAMTAIINQTDDDFILYSGDDSMTLPVLAIGGYGIVSVSAHIVGNEMKEMITQFKAGNIQAASKIHGELLPKFKAMFSAPSPTPVKAALNLQGVHVGGVRMPLIALEEDEINRIADAIK